MKPLGIALIGCGMISKVHLAALSEIPEAQICGIWSRNPETTKKCAFENRIKAYESFEAVCNDPEVRVVILCTPPGLHVDHGLQAAAAGKDLIIEKPLDVDYDKAKKLVETYRQKGLKLAVIYQNRYTEAARQVKTAIEQGLLGKLILGDAYVKWYRSPEYYASADWRGTWEIEGGGALITQAIHSVDLLQWFMGGVKSISGLTRITTHRIQTEDLSVAVLEFNNGALGVIEGSTAIVPGFKERIEIHGQKGTIVLEGGNIKEWKVEGCNEADYVRSEKIVYGKTNSPAISYLNHQVQLKEIICSIQNDSEPEVNGEEGLKSLEIVLGVYQSAQKQQKVYLK